MKTLRGCNHDYTTKTGIRLFKNKLLLFFAALGLHCYRWAFSSCYKWGLPFIAIYSFLIAVASLVAQHRIWACRPRQLQCVGSRVQAQQSWCEGLETPQHVESSWTRDRIYVPYIGRWILIHCTIREVQESGFEPSLNPGFVTLKSVVYFTIWYKFQPCSGVV